MADDDLGEKDDGVVVGFLFVVGPGRSGPFTRAFRPVTRSVFGTELRMKWLHENGKKKALGGLGNSRLLFFFVSRLRPWWEVAVVVIVLLLVATWLPGGCCLLK